MATGNIRILYENMADSAVLTATSEAMDVENLQDMQPQVVWRSTTDADQTITIPFSAPESVNCVALWNHNLTEDATIQIQGSSDPSFSTTEFDQTYDALDPAFGWGEFPWGMIGWGGISTEGWQYQFFVAWITLTVARYWRIIISDNANPDNYVQAGRLLVGQYWSPQNNMSWGYNVDWHDPSEITRTRGGSWRSDNQQPYRILKAQFKWLDVVESGGILEMKRSRGRRGDILVSAYPEQQSTRERRNTILGVLKSWSANAHNSVTLNSVSIVIEESL